MPEHIEQTEGERAIAEAVGVLDEAVRWARAEGVKNQAWFAAAVSWLDEFGPPRVIDYERWQEMSGEEQDALIASGWHPGPPGCKP